jgi:hypothetical protein
MVGKSDKTAGSGNTEFNAPFDVAVTPDGTGIVVSDSGNNRIQQFTTAGLFSRAFGAQGTGEGQFNTPKGLAYDSEGHLYVVDSGNNRVCLAVSSVVVGTSGSAGSALGQFQGLVNLGLGERGIYVADTGNNRVQQFDSIPAAEAGSPTPFNPRGSFSTGPSLNQPNAAAAVEDPLEEKFYIADTGNNRVILLKIPRDDPLLTWSTMVSYAVRGDTPDAISTFSSLTADGYRQAFLTVGTTDLISDLNQSQIGPLAPIFIKNDTAKYYFERNINGQLILFTVDFIRENGVWKIMEF